MVIVLLSLKEPYFSENEYIRINKLNEFVKDFKKEINSGVYISSFYFLQNITKEIYDTNTFISNKTTLNQKYIEFLNSETNNNSIKHWFSNFEKILTKEKFSFSYQIKNHSITEHNCTHILFNLKIDFEFSDKKTNTKFNDSYISLNYVSIFNLDDPIYHVLSNEKVIHKITFHDSNISQITNNTISDFAKTGKYFCYENSVSYLNRILGDHTKTNNGIFSFIYVPDYYFMDIFYENASIIDYDYLLNTTTNTYKVNNTEYWIYLDETDINNFNLEKE
jgi:hypothetical protein